MNARLTREIAKETNRPLSGKDVLDLVHGQANVITYPELKNIKHINQLLQPYNSCFILYLRNKTSGHWCCVNKVGTRIEFFDPYGGPIDSQLKFTYHKVPYLTKLLLNSEVKDGYRVTYNSYPFQHLNDHVKSCGRWCALRILLKDMPLLMFKKLMYGKNSDEVVSIITEMLL